MDRPNGRQDKQPVCKKMNALVINCSPVKNGATAEMVNLVAECIQEKYSVKKVCIMNWWRGNGGCARQSWQNWQRFRYWFGNYHWMDIIDTGLTDCYDERYVELAQENADRIGAGLGYAEGSNRMLEKLVSGRWDGQFVVAEPGQMIRHADFFG